MPADDGDRVSACFQRAYGCTLAQAVGWMSRRALRLTRGDLPTAEDLVQDTLLRLLTATPRALPSSPYAYCLRALTNQFLDDGRRNGAARRGGTNPAQLWDPLLESVATEPGPETLAVENETRQRVLDAIQQLPDHERKVVELGLDYFELGLDYRSYQEIAEILGIPVGTVRSRMHHARRHLRKLLQDLGREQTNDP